jgi:hypothetical protein
MRSLFPAHFKKSDKEVDALWKNAVFSFDANVLLHLYRYSPESRSELVATIDKIQDRLWLPEQAAYEYLKNRPQVIAEQIKHVEEAHEKVRNSKSKLTDQLENKNARAHPFYSAEAKDAYNKGVDALLVELNGSLDSLRALYSDDPTKETIADWFEGRTGQPFTDADFDTHCEEGEKRYTAKTPPGFKDGETKKAKETVSERRSRYGDWLIWRQLMDQAKTAKTDIIFVTDDAKEDWWLLRGDNAAFTPRPELIEEFHHETGQEILIYSFLKFLKHGKNQLNFDVSSEAEDETKSIRTKDISALAAAISKFGKETPSTDLHSKESPLPSPTAATSASHLAATIEQLRDLDMRIASTNDVRNGVIAQIGQISDTLPKASTDASRYNLKAKLEHLGKLQQKLADELGGLKAKRREVAIQRNLFLAAEKFKGDFEEGLDT